MADANPTAEIETTLGSITIELFAKQAPDTVKNFITLAEKGYYNGVICWRSFCWGRRRAGRCRRLLYRSPRLRPRRWRPERASPRRSATRAA
jgi:hypothetical protein